MDKPTKPTNLIPRSFGGTKRNFSASLQSSGYEDGVPAIYGGDNLNYQLDATGKELDYCEKIVDFINDIPIGKTITVDANNKLVYDYLDSLPSQSGNSGKYLTTDGNSPSWNALTFVNQDLSNLSTIGENRLHALKSYLDDGTLLTDTELYNDVVGYAHSTFDSSKFTKVGSPIVTDDGIANGFSSSNYLKTSSLNLTGKFRIAFKHTTTNSLSSVQILYSSNGNNSVILAFNGNKLWLLLSTDGTTFDICNQQSTKTLSTNTTYNIDFYFDGNNYKVDVDGDNYINISSTSIIYNISTLILNIGYWSSNANAFLLGSIDLKHFSITVDDVPVFKGNKTGIDTVKADNYTIETGSGYIDISTDGVLSFSGYPAKIQKADVLPSSVSDLEYYGSFIQYTQGTILTADWASFITFENVGTQINVKFVGSGNTNIGATAIQYTIQFGKKYYIKAVFKNGNCLFGIRGENENWTTNTSTYGNTSFTPYFKAFELGTLTSLGSNQNVYDLNDFKIYINGDLVYQPCLKIPYTESKTGAKVVDAIYRERVIDTYNQFGSALYHTIDETNNNVTLPFGETNGNIIKRADGNFVIVCTDINNSTAIGSYDIDLSSILPNDNYDYLCTFIIAISRQDNDYHDTKVTYKVGETPYLINNVQGGSSSTDTIVMREQFFAIIDNSRTINLTIENIALYQNHLFLINYRRLGANY